MTTLLSALPADALGQILGYDVASHCSLLLWQTGNRAMQAKIALSVHRVELRNLNWLAWCRMPKYLVHLRNLKELIVNRGAFKLQGLEDAASVLKQLPSSLEKLELGFANATSLLASSDPNHASKGESEGTKDFETCLPLNELYPTLKHLRVAPSGDLSSLLPSCLPKSLLSLDCGLPPKAMDIELFFYDLPKGLTRLDSQTEFFASKATLGALPDNLLELNLMCHNPLEACHVSSLPSTITKLGQRVSPNFTDEICAVLPSQLVSFYPWEVSTDSLEEALSALPSTLKELSLMDEATLSYNAQLLSLLPRGLTILSCTIDWEEMKPDVLPPQLTSLTVQGEAPTFESEFEKVLPASLTYLDMKNLSGELDIQFISILPRSLRTFKAFFSAETSGITDPAEIRFPPQLEHLEAYYNYSYDDYPLPFCNWPKTLKTLRGIEVSTSGLKLLPPYLTHLEISAIYSSESFNAEDPDLIERARFLQRCGRNYENPDPRDLEPLARVSIFDLLPRTLRHLNIESCTDIVLEVADFGRLPRVEILEFLVYMDRIPADCFLPIPKDYLQVVKMNLENLEDRHFRALGRKIIEIDITQVNNFADRLTVEAAKYMPLNPASSVNNEAVKGAFDELSTLRAAALTLPDSSEFFKLARPSV